MQQWKLIGIGLMLLVKTSLAQQAPASNASFDARARAYIEQFKDLAIEEQRRTGIPAAVKLAQGIHETSGGQSILCSDANNHFGIKCKKEWTGETFKYTDDAPDECFRKYKHYKESYLDHSEYLKGSPRYASLFQLPITDYTGWCTGLKRCGYATNPRYAQTLIKLIEDYKLQDYTYAALQKETNPVRQAEQVNKVTPVERPVITPAPVREVVPEKDVVAVPPASPQAGKSRNSGMTVSYEDDRAATQAAAPVAAPPVDNGTIPAEGEVVFRNGLKAFYARKGSMLLQDAVRHNVRYAKLLELNDLPDAPLEADMYIYLEKKFTKGLRSLHVVKPGETMTQIAQAEGIQLKYLKFYNRIEVNEEPVEGALLRLQEYTDEKPEVYVKIDPRQVRTVPPGNTPPTMPAMNESGQRNAPESDYIIKPAGSSSSEAAARRRKSLDQNDAPVETGHALSPSQTHALSPSPSPATETVKGEELNYDDADKYDNITKSPPLPPVQTGHALSPNIPSSDHALSPNTPPAPEPKDEFERLKARLDKVVYAADKTTPAETPKSEPTKPAPQATSKAGSGYYTVKKGDTAFTIAKQHNITMRQLREWNNLDFQSIKEGQQLRVK